MDLPERNRQHRFRIRDLKKKPGSYYALKLLLIWPEEPE
jgi:hypothetical protein